MVVYGETPAEGGEAAYEKFYQEVSGGNYSSSSHTPDC